MNINYVKLFSYFGVNLHSVFNGVSGHEEAYKRFEQAKIEAKKNYKKLALKYHPDRNDGDDTKMKELNSLYDLLEKSKYNIPRPQPTFRVTSVTFYNQTSTTTTTDGTSTTIIYF